MKQTPSSPRRPQKRASFQKASSPRPQRPAPEKAPAAKGVRTREPLDERKILSLWAEAFGENCQQALSSLCALCKDSRAKELLNGQPNRAELRSLLSDERPKVRKNTARLLGLLLTENDVPALCAALSGEQTLFVLPSLLLALGNAGTAGRDALEACQAALRAGTPPFANAEEKHLAEISAALSAALSRTEAPSFHRFSGLKQSHDILLCAPSGCGGLLLSEAQEHGISGTLCGDCLRVKTADYAALFSLRCFDAALFPLGNCPLPASANRTDLAQFSEAAAKKAAGFSALLCECFENPTDTPFRYRIELRGAPENRSALIHALSAALSKDPLLQNAPSSYEAELRLEFDGKRCAIFARLYRPEDVRFSYRKGAISASIHPVTAACMMRFLRPHLRPGSRVVDPCCGTGTLLVERALCGCAPGALVGVDISSEALSIARENARAAQVLYPEALGCGVDFIGGNLLSFRPRQPFDELIANLPFGTRVGTQEANKALYSGLMRRLKDYLAPHGRAVLYTTQRAPLLRLAMDNGWEIEAEHRFEAGGLSPWCMVLRRRKKKPVPAPKAPD